MQVQQVDYLIDFALLTEQWDLLNCQQFQMLIQMDRHKVVDDVQMVNQ